MSWACGKRRTRAQNDMVFAHSPLVSNPPGISNDCCLGPTGFCQHVCTTTQEAPATFSTCPTTMVEHHALYTTELAKGSCSQVAQQRHIGFFPTRDGDTNRQCPAATKYILSHHHFQEHLPTCCCPKQPVSCVAPGHLLVYSSICAQRGQVGSGQVRVRSGWVGTSLS